MKCSKKYAKEGFLSDDVFIFISNTPKSKVLNFVFSVRKLVTCFIFGTTHFLISTISSSDSEIGKIGISTTVFRI